MCAGGRRWTAAGSRAAPSPRASRAVGRAQRQPLRGGSSRAGQVQPEVEVAQPEPGVGAPSSPRLLERPRRVAAHAPALLGVDPAGERVEHRVQVGRDVQPVRLEVVADVADDRDRRRIDHLDQALEEACAADTAGEHRDATVGHAPHIMAAADRSDATPRGELTGDERTANDPHRAAGERRARRARRRAVGHRRRLPPAAGRGAGALVAVHDRALRARDPDGRCRAAT